VRRRWTHSIRARLVALVLAVALPLFGVLLWGFWAEVRREHGDARELALRIARSTASDLEASNERSNALLQRMAERPKIRQPQAGNCDSLFAIVDFFPQYLTLLLYDTHGALVCVATPQPEDRAYTGAALAAIGERLRAGGAVPRDPLVLTTGGRWISVAFQPVESDGVTNGILALVQYLDLGVDAYPPETVLTIADRDGRIVARSRDGGRVIGGNVHKSGIGRLVQQGDEGRGEAAGVDGVLRQYGYRRIRGTGWLVFAGVPSGVAMAAVRSLLWRGVVAGVLMIGVVVLLAIRISTTIEQPLDVLAGAAERLGREGYGDEGESEPVLAGGPNEIATVADAFNRMTVSRADAERALEASRAELEALSKKLLEVQEEERSRIAREIHDEMAQLLTALKMDVGGLLRAAEPLTAEQQSMAARIRTALAETMSSVHRISAELRPAVLDDFGLVAAIESEARLFEQRTGIECEVSFPEGLSLGADAEAAVYRIVQEAMTNVARHADAGRMEIRAVTSGGEVCIEIRDDGRGIAPAQLADRRSLGIVGMRERARGIGATLLVEGAAGGGTIVSLRLARRTA
jgi:signal transduction histidine kinase